MSYTQHLRRYVDDAAILSMFEHFERDSLRQWTRTVERDALSPRLARVFDIVNAAPGARNAINCAVAQALAQAYLRGKHV